MKSSRVNGYFLYQKLWPDSLVELFLWLHEARLAGTGVMFSPSLLSDLSTQCFEKERTDFDANGFRGQVEGDSHTRPKIDVESSRRHHSFSRLFSSLKP